MFLSLRGRLALDLRCRHPCPVGCVESMIVLENIFVDASEDDHFVTVHSYAVEGSFVGLDLLGLHAPEFMDVNFSEPVCEIVMD